MDNDDLQNFKKLGGAYKQESRIKECFHHNKDECRGKIKQAHSLQKNGRLSIVESEVKGNQVVYTFTSFNSSKERLMEDLIPIGKKEASTFYGFCDFHDTNLFSPIENFPFDHSDKHLYLHSYRSFAHSYHRKLEELNIYSNPESEFLKAIPKSMSDLMLEGIMMGVNDVKDNKANLDKAIEEDNFQYLEYFFYEKEGLYPFAVSSQMSPKVSYKNKPMNNHVDPNVPWSQLIITFLPDEKSTIVILAAFPDDTKAINLLDELAELSDLNLEKAITSLIIANCENTFFSPKFWDKLSSKERRLLLDEFTANTESMEYHNKFFKSKFNFFDDRYEISKL